MIEDNDFTTITVSKGSRSVLMNLKYHFELSSVEEVISLLIKPYKKRFAKIEDEVLLDQEKSLELTKEKEEKKA